MHETWDNQETVETLYDETEDAMAVLHIPAEGNTLREMSHIAGYLQRRGIKYERWEAQIALNDGASEAEILAAYAADVQALMKEGGYVVADVMNVHDGTPDVTKLRDKFLREHTHVEDEVRFFVDGSALFWFNTDEDVFSVLLEKGDLIRIPAHMKHWSDLGERPRVKAIRLFIDKAGWVPLYTESGVDQRYNPTY